MSFPLPLLATIGGVEVVIIAASEYERLRPLANLPPLAPVVGVTRSVMTPDRLIQEMRFRPPGGKPANTVLGDEEVARFLIENMGRMKNIALGQACRDQFGIDRSPSDSRIGGFMKAVRTWFEEHPEAQA